MLGGALRESLCARGAAVTCWGFSGNGVSTDSSALLLWTADPCAASNVVAA
jgi:hypothetical protein